MIIVILLICCVNLKCAICIIDPVCGMLSVEESNTMSDRKQKPPISIRLPDDLKEALEEIAKHEHRSLHNLIVHILYEYIEHKDDKP